MMMVACLWCGFHIRVFVDGGGLGQELRNFDNVEVHVFSIQNGWDFDQPEGG